LKSSVTLPSDYSDPAELLTIPIANKSKFLNTGIKQMLATVKCKKAYSPKRQRYMDQSASANLYN